MHQLPRGLVVTDPPYNVGSTTRTTQTILSVDDYQAMLAKPARCRA